MSFTAYARPAAPRCGSIVHALGRLHLRRRPLFHANDALPFPRRRDIAAPTRLATAVPMRLVALRLRSERPPDMEQEQKKATPSCVEAACPVA